MDESLKDDTGSQSDDFDLAFDAAIGLSEEADTAAADEQDVVDTSDVQDEVVPEKDEPAAEGAKPEPVAVPEVKPEPVVIPEVKPEPMIDHAAEAAKVKADADAKEAADKAAADALALEQFTADEQESITQTATDFPEVAKALKAVERVTAAKVANFYESRIKALEERFNQQIAPALQVTKQYAKNAHEAAILKEHPDAFELYPKLTAWVDAAPSILKTAYNNTLDTGNASQISELYSIFKKENAVVVPAVKQEVKEEKAAKEKKLNAQEGVRGRHTSGRAAVDPDDFDGAFDKFAATA